jgi:tRNA nucleotidyltransferase/poly(A) polymerase
MEETGLLPLILPELSKSRGIGQKGNHLFDVFEHSVYSADGASKHALEIPLAALLHDLGKTDTFKLDEHGIPAFHGHEHRSVEIAHTILKRLKFPKALEEKVCHLIAHHMFNYEPTWTDAAVRRFLSRVNPRYIPDLFYLRRADSYGTNGEHTGPEPLLSFQKRIEEVVAKDEALTIKDLKINGNDLFKKAGIPKGPVMGVILEFLLEAVLDDPSLNDSEKLLNLAVNFYENRLRPDGR